MPFKCDAFAEIESYSERGPRLVGTMVSMFKSTDPSLWLLGPEAKWDNEHAERVDELYFDVLLRSLIDVLSFTFPTSWTNTLPPYTVGMRVTSSPVDPKEVTVDVERLKELFPQSLIMKEVPGMSFNLPPKTAVVPEPGDIGLAITFKNPFATVRIGIRKSEVWDGVGEGVRRLCQMEDDGRDRYRTIGFIIKMSAQFERLRTGHPEMPKYKEWVDTMFTATRNDCDSDLRWKSLLETYQIFYKGSSPPLQ